MKKLILSSLCMLMGLTSMSAQTALQNEILEVAHRTNNYFMTKYSDPTIDTFVKKKRTSNLWTRAVYYEGLMALYEIDPQQHYLDYTDKWADYHKWTARGSVNDTDADNQCCQQTYMDRYVQTGGKKDLSKVKENLDHQMSTKRVNYWTWIDAIQMAMPAYAKYAKITGERKYLDYAMNSYKWTVIHWLMVSSTRKRVSGGETRITCHLTRRRMAATAIGAVATVGYMQPWSA